MLLLRCVDLNFSERSSETPELTCASLVHSSKIVLLQEENKLSLAHMESMIDMALEGNRKIYDILKLAVRRAISPAPPFLQP